MENYSSATGLIFKEKVGKAILEEIEAGNYFAFNSKASIVSALRAVTKQDSDDLI